MGKDNQHVHYPMLVSDIALLCKSINPGCEMGDDTQALVVSRLEEVLKDSTSSKRGIRFQGMRRCEIAVLEWSHIDWENTKKPLEIVAFPGVAEGWPIPRRGVEPLLPP